MYRYRCSASSHTASVAFGRNAGSGAEQPLVPGEGALVVAHREAREQVDRHPFTLTPQPCDLHPEKNQRCPVGALELDVDDLLGAPPTSSTTSLPCGPP